MRFKAVVLMLILVLATPVWAGRASKKKGVATPQLVSHLPKDPLIVSTLTLDDLAGMFEEMLGLLEQFGEDVDLERVRAKLAEFDRNLGCSVKDDLLSRLGPEIGFVLDLPPIDQIMAAMSAPETGIPEAFGGVGLLAQVREPEALDACLRKLVGMSGATLVDDGDLRKLEWQPEDGKSAEAPGMYYGIVDGVFALGLAPDSVRAALKPRGEGQRLADGADFARVFSHLDRSSQHLTYLNLPKATEMVRTSPMLQMMIGQDPEAKKFVDFLLSSELLSTGIGSTAVEIDGGTRTTTFAPSGLSGGGAMTGIVAAIAIPNFLNAVDRGKQKRTMADLRSVATSCEEYSIDNNLYPGPTDGWVPLSEIRESLQPAYMRMLPTEDGWGHTLMYWSDTETYRIVSPGKDGEIEHDWSGEIEPHSTQEFVRDIVFGDGQFLVWPEGEQE